MDISETYIKQCEKAYNILGKRKPEEGDYWYVENERYGGKAVMLISGYETDSGVYGPSVSDKSNLGGWNLLFPIYRQDQLQAMIAGKGFTLPESLPWISKFVVDEGANKYGSMERLWLAFTTKTECNKIWDGTDWVA